MVQTKGRSINALCLPPMTSDRLLGKARTPLSAVSQQQRLCQGSYEELGEEADERVTAKHFSSVLQPSRRKKNIFQDIQMDYNRFFFLSISEVRRVRESPPRQTAQMVFISSVKVETEVHWSLPWQALTILTLSWSRGPWIQENLQAGDVSMIILCGVQRDGGPHL